MSKNTWHMTIRCVSIAVPEFRHRTGTLLALALALSGCALIPAVLEPFPIRDTRVAPLAPIYDLPEVSLAAKTAHLTQRILESHLSDDGLLQYRVDLECSRPCSKSADMADAPSWHGHLLLGQSFREATLPSPAGRDLVRRLIHAAALWSQITEQPGLIGRSYLRTDRREDWMQTEAEKPTRYWREGGAGYWWRTGSAKGHVLRHVMGLAAVIRLSGDDEALQVARQAAIDVALRLIPVHNIKGFDGQTTEFGRLSEWRVDGISALILAAIFRTAAAAGSPEAAKAYKRLVDEGAGRSIRDTLRSMGAVYSRVGRSRFGHSSDDELIYSAALTLWLSAGSEDEPLLEDVRAGLRGVWTYARPMAKPFLTFTHLLVAGPDEQAHTEALQTLRWFPPDKRILGPLDREDTHLIQPLPNQRINSHYEKGNVYNQARRRPDTAPVQIEYSGQDYLGAYWMGRWAGWISSEE